MKPNEALDIVGCLAWHDLRPSTEEIEEAIKTIGEALKKQEQDNWTPCKEELPETDEELWSDPVLVTRKAYYPNGEKWYKVETATYCEKLLSSDGIYRDIPGWASGKDVYNTDCIVAWMPLPAPYKEEEEI